MINTKTMLVLGAGASKPYGFPIGNKLVKDIRDFAGEPHAKNWCSAFCEWLSGNAKDELRQWWNTGDRMRSLSDALIECRPHSIDEFLERRPDVADVGRLVISILLLMAERASEKHLWDDATEGHWYDYLKQQLVNPAEMLGQDQLRIITFNYDRSLEHCLFRSLKPYYSTVMSEEAYTAAMKQLQVLHIYGNLGPLPWQSTVDAVPYGKLGYEQILTASKNVKVLHQGEEDAVQQNFKVAQEWLRWADRVLFFGFGFHKDNVERLTIYQILGKERKDRDIRASCFGLDATSRDRVEWGHRDHSAPPVIRFAPSDADCYTFLHDHAILS